MDEIFHGNEALPAVEKQTPLLLHELAKEVKLGPPITLKEAKERQGAQSIEVAKNYVERELARQKKGKVEFDVKNIFCYWEDDPNFNVAFEYIKSNHKQYPANATLDKNKIKNIVSLKPTGNQKPFLVALDASDQLLGMAW